MPAELHRAFAELSTPLVAGACLRLSIQLRLAPPGMYLDRRRREPDYTLRRHLREIGGAIEV